VVAATAGWGVLRVGATVGPLAFATLVPFATCAAAGYARFFLFSFIGFFSRGYGVLVFKVTP
jgi:hypothetical protein